MPPVLSSGAGAGVSDVQRPPVGTEHAFVHHFAQGWVREDRVHALVLGAAASGHPGLLVDHFTDHDSGKLPCPVMIIPGSLSDERLEQLS